MMCTTGLHGGVCHHTSTPHKSGIKMKKKKKKNYAHPIVVCPSCIHTTVIAFGVSCINLDIILL